MYMSYCRFEGTRQELQACLNTVEEHAAGEAEYPVSENEIRHFKRMVTEFVDWLQDAALLDEDGYLDDGRLEEACEAMRRGNAE